MTSGSNFLIERRIQISGRSDMKSSGSREPSAVLYEAIASVAVNSNGGFDSMPKTSTTARRVTRPSALPAFEHILRTMPLNRQRQSRPAEKIILVGCVKIISAYVGHNITPAEQLPLLIQNVHEVLDGMKTVPRAARPTPPVDPQKSVMNDYIICLEDGKRFKSLKRHLRSKYGMTPEEYRRKWNLDFDYPMVAPSYGRRRSELAKLTRLGVSRKNKPALHE
jgi:predicted transcriptional regulator